MPIHDWARVTDGIFHHFHHSWIEEIQRSLNGGHLPGDYYALAEQVAGGLGPDVLTLEYVSTGPATPAGNGPVRSGDGETDTSAPSNGCVAVATAPPRVRFTAEVAAPAAPRRRKVVAIRHASGDRVVAVIEIVSPANKDSRDGLRAFIAKAAELLEAGIHLLVIDLWPPGPREPQGIHGAVWAEVGGGAFEQPADRPLTQAAYEAGEKLRAWVEPTALGLELATMPLFLEPGEYVPLPLEPSYRAAFAAVPGRWRRVLEVGC